MGHTAVDFVAGTRRPGIGAHASAVGIDLSIGGSGDDDIAVVANIGSGT
jgi:hypothetical protein